MYLGRGGGKVARIPQLSLSLSLSLLYLFLYTHVLSCFARLCSEESHRCFVSISICVRHSHDACMCMIKCSVFMYLLGNLPLPQGSSIPNVP
ncbi:hypothetical protein F4775DRAFT_503554 [Biscogniauxia sp. FL1348]|nr:hypothetical protein F4775DRAFT_503554 [Biscogniauxia sp. FL1348]